MSEIIFYNVFFENKNVWKWGPEEISECSGKVREGYRRISVGSPATSRAPEGCQSNFERFVGASWLRVGSPGFICLFVSVLFRTWFRLSVVSLFLSAVDIEIWSFNFYFIERGSPSLFRVPPLHQAPFWGHERSGLIMTSFNAINQPIKASKAINRWVNA